MFIDQVTITVEAGRGGDGCESYERRSPRKFYPHGGDGGAGGNVILRAAGNVSSLDYFWYKKIFRAEAGGAGGSNRKTGKTGRDLILHVPAGTTITSRQDGLLIRDLQSVDEEVIVVRGGQPGCGNQDNRKVHKGRDGETLDIILDYKVICDVAFIGLPNSGKTTLLTHLTNAKALPSEHPFTTQMPQLGVVECDNYDRLVVCDMPSIAAGSSEGKGLGNRFLKHALRAQVFFYVIEPISRFSSGLSEACRILDTELAAYAAVFAHTPKIILINKVDTIKPKDYAREKEQLRKKYRCVYNISALLGTGIKEVLAKVQELI